MSKLIALAFADLHINKWKAPETHKGNRLIDSLEPFKQITNRAHHNKIPIFFAGDLFHKPKGLSNEVISAFTDIFNNGVLNPRLGSKSIMYAISGNHDQSQKNTYKHRSP